MGLPKETVSDPHPQKIRIQTKHRMHDLCNKPALRMAGSGLPDLQLQAEVVRRVVKINSISAELQKCFLNVK